MKNTNKYLKNNIHYIFQCLDNFNVIKLIKIIYHKCTKNKNVLICLQKLQIFKLSFRSYSNLNLDKISRVVKNIFQKN